ncbi:hypothetical protein [Candidatus Poriferisocius sp.]|uniref:hypothetical protein n=1 Tax=Candidatus Poriferisocius sp. TaxID=3101276 RepID=UPI003B01F0D7
MGKLDTPGLAEQRRKTHHRRDLWAQIIEQTQTRPIAFHRAKPNTANPAHDQATRLATQAADQQDTVEEQSLF